jgi:hypothetical protein
MPTIASALSLAVARMVVELGHQWHLGVLPHHQSKELTPKTHLLFVKLSLHSRLVMPPQLSLYLMRLQRKLRMMRTLLLSITVVLFMRKAFTPNFLLHHLHALLLSHGH